MMQENLKKRCELLDNKLKVAFKILAQSLDNIANIPATVVIAKILTSRDIESEEKNARESKKEVEHI